MFDFDAGCSFLSLLHLSAVHLRKVRHTRLPIVLHEAPKYSSSKTIISLTRALIGPHNLDPTR